MKKLPLLGVLLVGLFLLGAGCGDTTTDTTTTDESDTTTVEDTTDATASDGAITVTQPASGDTISSPFAIKTNTTTPDKTIYIRVVDADGSELVTAEGEPNASGDYNAPYVIYFGGDSGTEGAVEVFHKDGTDETDLVSIPVTFE